MNPIVQGGCFFCLVFVFKCVDLIDITSLVGWEIFDNFHIFIFFDQSCFLVGGGKLTSLGGYQNSHPLTALLPHHRLNIDRCMIKASDHDKLDYA